MRTPWILPICTLLAQCTIDRTVLPLNNAEVEVLKDFKDLRSENQIQINPENEPGQQLSLCLTLVSKENKRPLVNQEMALYHTSSRGEYVLSYPNDESSARLNGLVTTDMKGRVFVQTILPGDYGGSSDNRHIHTTVFGAHPEAYDIHFKQYTGLMGRNFISGSDQHFLVELKQADDGTLVVFQTIDVKRAQIQDEVGDENMPECQWCGAKEAPESVGWESVIANQDEPGERLILEGTVYQKDGKTPARDVIIYAYHTNSRGVYEKNGSEMGNGLRHGHLRGWARTNGNGNYRFHTIRPAPYPNHSEPAHIHMTLMGDGFEEYWINATWFMDDKTISEEQIKKLTRTGGFSNIVELRKNDEGIWMGNRDIIINPPE